jgi:GNAT superfamily N-acetyltransferase
MQENLFEDEEYRIEQFVLDEKTMPEALDVLRKSYVNVYSDEGGTTEFTDTMFNILFNSPSIPRDYFVRAVHKPTGKMVGFIGAVPRTLYYRGKTYKAGFPSFLAVVPEHRKKELAFRMAAFLVNFGKEKGFDAGVAFFEPEEHGISTGKAIARELNLPMIEISTIRKFLIRVFDVEAIAKVTRLKWYEKLGFL